MRLLGIGFLVAAAVLFIMNLKRVANAGTFFTALPLFIIGIALVVRAKKGDRK